MTIDEIKQELLSLGKDPYDYNIEIYENGYRISPKWYTENKEIAKKEDAFLGLEVSQREIENIELGQQLSNLEIQILELQLREVNND